VRILLAGRNGQVGWELERVLGTFGDVAAFDRKALDLSQPESIRSEIRRTNPEIIVNAAAYTAVDKAESQLELAMKVNGVAPGLLAEEAKRLGALLVHYSTDYVFDGSKASPYVEEDATNPLSVYGKSKLAGEEAIRRSGCRHVILRTSWVYGPRGKNFFLTIAAKAAAGQDLRVVADQKGVPTTSRFLAEETVALLKKEASGVLHLVPAGETTWYEFAREIVREVVHDKVRVDPIPTAEFPTPARRPANSVLDNRKAAALLGRGFADWRKLLEACAQEAGRRSQKP
jgi:dTDP-4-dehydrorhamnose reductase